MTSERIFDTIILTIKEMLKKINQKSIKWKNNKLVRKTIKCSVKYEIIQIIIQYLMVKWSIDVASSSNINSPTLPVIWNLLLKIKSYSWWITWNSTPKPLASEVISSNKTCKLEIVININKTNIWLRDSALILIRMQK